MNKGWIKFYRKAQDNHLYFLEPFTKFQAWMDLLLLANHKDNTLQIRGIMILVKSGQVMASDDFLAKRWKWSRGKVRRFLARLSSNTVQQIVQEKNNVCSIYSICNWESYQGDSTADGTANSTASGTANGTTDGTHQRMYKKVKNVKESKDKFLPYPNFMKWWELYPNGQGKAVALKSWIKRGLELTDVEIQLKAVRDHMALDAWTRDNGSFIPMGSTYLNQERDHDELNKEKPRADKKVYS